jgi:hypothetical protein
LLNSLCMNFKGSLSHLSAIDLLQSLHACGRTGTLRLRAGGFCATVCLQAGAIAWASGPGGLRLGDLLVESGVLEDSTLMAALSLQIKERPRRSLAQVLIDSGAVTQAQVLAAIERQIEHVIQGLAFWTQGDYEFESGDWLPGEELELPRAVLAGLIRLDTKEVLRAALRLKAELSRVRRGHAG